MRLGPLLAAIVAVSGFPPALHAQKPPMQPRPVAVDDQFQIRDVQDPQLSPDGQWLAYSVKTPLLKTDKNEERIWMVPERNRSIPAKLNPSCTTESSMW